MYPVRKASKPAPPPGHHNEEILRKLDALQKVDLENRVQDIRIRGKRITDIAPDLIAEEERKSYMPMAAHSCPDFTITIFT